MNKKNLRPADELWRRGINATEVAARIDNLVRPTSVAIAPILNDLEKRHGLSFKLSCTGFVIERGGDVLYEMGKYMPVGANTHEKKSEMLRYAFVMLRWCSVHFPTELLKQNKGWIYGQ